MKPSFVVFREARCTNYPEVCRARVVMETDADGLVPVLAFGYPDGDPRRHTRLKPAEALPFVAFCRAHHRYMTGKPLKGTLGKAPCDGACTGATGSAEFCRCECGGMNHGLFV